MTALFIIGLLLSVASTVMQVTSQRKVSKSNAAIMRQEAEAKRAKARYDADLLKRKRHNIASTRQAVASASGLSGSLSFENIFEGAAEDTAADVAAILQGAESSALLSESEASLYRLQGKQATQAGYLKGGSTLLSGLSRLNTGGGTKSFQGDYYTGYPQ